MATADKPIGDDLLPEMTDWELLVAAGRVGTFDFLNGAEEDGYNDLLSKHE